MAVALPGIPPMASEFYARILELRDKDVKASPCAFSTIFFDVIAHANVPLHLDVGAPFMRGQTGSAPGWKPF